MKQGSFRGADNGTETVSTGGKGRHLCAVGRRDPAYPAGPSDGLREDDRICKSDGGLRAPGRPCADPGTPRGAA